MTAIHSDRLGMAMHGLTITIGVLRDAGVLTEAEYDKIFGALWSVAVARTKQEIAQAEVTEWPTVSC